MEATLYRLDMFNLDDPHALARATAEILKAERIKQCLTLDQLAAICDIASPSRLRKYEEFEAGMLLGVFIALCDGLGVDPIEVFRQAGRVPDGLGASRSS